MIEKQLYSSSFILQPFIQNDLLGQTKVGKSLGWLRYRTGIESSVRLGHNVEWGGKLVRKNRMKLDAHGDECWRERPFL